MKKIILIVITLIITSLSGCFAVRMTVNNIGDSLFRTPEKVNNKITEPLRDSVKLSVLWVGHSTSIIQIYDKVIITDPFLTSDIGGVIQRRKEAGFDINNLSRLNLILVSHSHTDHLSFGSLDMLAEKFPNCNLLFPAGDEYYMPNFNLNLIRVDISQSLSTYIGKPVYVDDIKITPVYSLHPGGRYGFDTYLWKETGATGYIIEYKDVCVYFPGDTGYKEEQFTKIGDSFKINLALLPIGPCRNCDSTGMWYHTSSMESLLAFEELKADYMIPIHYGAIQYFSDPNYPLIAMEKMLDNPDSKFHYLSDKVKILKEGEQIIWKDSMHSSGDK